jgi:hypothetical protein
MITEHDSALARKEIHIGMVGANAKASWAKLSHVPAINGLPARNSRLWQRATSRVRWKQLKPSVLIAGFPIPSR